MNRAQHAVICKPSFDDPAFTNPTAGIVYDTNVALNWNLAWTRGDTAAVSLHVSFPYFDVSNGWRLE